MGPGSVENGYDHFLRLDDRSKFVEANGDKMVKNPHEMLLGNSVLSWSCEFSDTCLDREDYKDTLLSVKGGCCQVSSPHPSCPMPHAPGDTSLGP